MGIPLTRLELVGIWILLIWIASAQDPVLIRLDSEIQAIPPEFHERLDLWIESELPSKLSLELPGRFQELRMLEGNCSVQDARLDCQLDPGLNLISLRIRDALWDLGANRWILERDYPMSYRVLSLSLLIPLNYFIHPNLSFPRNYLEFDYAGMQAYLWKDYNSSGFLLMVLIQPRSPGLGWELMLIPGIAAAGLGFWMYKLRSRRGQLPLAPGLLESEQKVIQCLLKSKEHQLMQYQLQKLTGFSKPKLSRVLRSLEQRGLIEKHPHGSTNLVKLKQIQRRDQDSPEEIG